MAAAVLPGGGDGGGGLDGGGGGGGLSGGLGGGELLGDAFEVEATAQYVVSRGFARVGLQFPDELLELSAGVAAALSAACQRRSPEAHEVQLFVMADTSYGSCCVDEIAAAHVDAQCVVHYGHACLTATSRLPAKFVFGKASLDLSDCAAKLRQLADNSQKPLVILHAPELSHAMAALQAAVMQCSSSERDVARPHLIFAKVRCTKMEPSPAAASKRREMGAGPTSQGDCQPHRESEVTREGRHVELPSGDSVGGLAREEHGGGEAPISSPETALGPQGEPENGLRVVLGGLEWCLPPGASEQDVVLAWIGPEGPALTHIMLVHHRCQFVQYDPATKALHTDFVKHSKLLSRRQVFAALLIQAVICNARDVVVYYLVERAKEAGIVGIILGTLAVAGYQAVLERLRTIIKSAGKKHYTFLMGKLNPAKLANFPECDIFVLLACPQTALLDNRDYLAPIITPFEAEIAFTRGRTWTGAYRLDMDLAAESTRSVIDSRAGQDPGDLPQAEKEQQDSDEPRFSFISGGYVNDNIEHDGGTGTTSLDLALALSTGRALQLRQTDGALTTGATAQAAPVRSGAEYLALRRTYQGLEIPLEGDPEVLELSPRSQHRGAPRIPPSSILQGRTGRATKYMGENQ
eukprot:SM000002S05704  [mRNA]  locus=s2:1744841:1748976:+ [translate_table: standard]